MRKSRDFTLHIRTQFSFQATDCKLNRILSGIADGNANITAYTQTKRNKLNAVKLVVGSSESGSHRQNRVVREVLRSQGVPFCRKKVIQILDIEPGVPGFISSVYGALIRKVHVFAFYDGENNASFVSVSNLKAAVKILKKLASG